MAGDKEETPRATCPITGRGGKVDVPPLEERQKPAEGQRMPLATRRVVSSIPKPAEGASNGGESLPEETPTCPAGHGDAGGSWEYPSEQMFYNAMKRKGWDPREEDMRATVQLHNAVNERAWGEVLKWERELHCDECEHPRLKTFRGRPTDLSPKALLMGMLGYARPFDRHDWTVDRCGKDVRYVIDFYGGDMRRASSGKGVAMHLDTRPALDSPGAVWDRMRMWARRTFFTS